MSPAPTSKAKGKAKVVVKEDESLQGSSDDGGSFSLGSDDSASDSVDDEYSSDIDSQDQNEDDEEENDEILELLKESQDAGQSEYQTGLRSGKPKSHNELGKIKNQGSSTNRQKYIATDNHIQGSSKGTSSKRQKLE